MPERDLAITVGDGFTLAAVGDCIISRPLSQLAVADDRFASVVRLLRDAHATFGNLETSITPPDAPGVVPMGVPEDWTVRAEPATAADLRSLGFDLFGRANNHSTDWGTGGLRETGRHLDAAGLVHAGAGETLAAARAPRYLETPWGRVGLVSATATLGNDAAPALDAFGEVPARPGVHAVDVTPVVTVPGEVMDSLGMVREAFPDIDLAWTPNLEPKQLLELQRVRYVRGESFDVRFEIDADDRVALLRSVRQAAQHADLSVLAIHAHHGEHAPDHPPAYLRELAHAAIDHGAGAVIVSGPHRLAPVELHAGRPILYGLGNFIWSDMTEPLQGYFYRHSRARVAAARRSGDADRRRPHRGVERGELRRRGHLPCRDRHHALRGRRGGRGRPRPGRAGLRTAADAQRDPAIGHPGRGDGDPGAHPRDLRAVRDRRHAPGRRRHHPDMSRPRR